MLKCVKEEASLSYFDISLEQPLKKSTNRYSVYDQRYPISIVKSLYFIIFYVLNGNVILKRLNDINNYLYLVILVIIFKKLFNVKFEDTPVEIFIFDKVFTCKIVQYLLVLEVI